MQSAVKYEELVQREIMSFPKKQLPHLVRLLRMLRRDFAEKSDSGTFGADASSDWREGLKALCGSVSSSHEFMARKEEEKRLEL